MREGLLLKLTDIAEKGGGLKLRSDLLKSTAKFSRSEIFTIGVARSGGEANNIYVRYRIMDHRGNFKIEYFDLNGMNGKGELQLLSVYTRGLDDWAYLGSFMTLKEQNNCKVVGHGGLNDQEVVDLILKTVSILEEKLPTPTPINGNKALLERIVKSKHRMGRASL